MALFYNIKNDTYYPDSKGETCSECEISFGVGDEFIKVIYGGIYYHDGKFLSRQIHFVHLNCFLEFAKRAVKEEWVLKEE